MALGRRLAGARERLGYRQEDVAAALGVSREMVSYWETGARRPNDRQLVALARLFRLDVGHLLLAEDFDEMPDEAEMLFRGAEGEAPPAARPGIAEFRAFLDAYARLAEIVGVELHGLHQSPFLPAKGEGSKDEVRRKAEEVREHLRLGVGPIVDLDRVCEMLGVTVFRADLGADLRTTISGGFFAHPVVGFSLLINLRMTPGRRRFTIAHELAHALFHSGRMTRFVLSGVSKDPRERFADRFAGEFLMPTEGVRRALEEHGIRGRVSDPVEVVGLQRYFHVSYATALVRLRQGNFLTEETFEELSRVRPVVLARALGYEVDDDEYVRDPDEWRVRRFPGGFLRLLLHAVREERVSVPTAAKLTGLSIGELTELAYDRGEIDVAARRELGEYEASGVWVA